MTNYTTTSLIAELKKFPHDTPIRTELAFIYNYDKMCDIFREEMSDKDFLEYTKGKATDIAIFEGSWKENNISDLNNILPNYIDGWYKTKVTISKSEYDELIDKANSQIKISNININTNDDPEAIKNAISNIMEIVSEEYHYRNIDTTNTLSRVIEEIAEEEEEVEQESEKLSTRFWNWLRRK